MEVLPNHFVAIIGGAIAGSEAASRLADRGIYTVVFEQNLRPYGKIEDGLPKWHVKLQDQEEDKIDQKLSKANVHFVPNTMLGRDIDFDDLVNNWEFSAILLANGAWKDRPLPVAGVDEFIDNGLIYQNPLVCWFNHYHESDFNGPKYHLPDDAIIVGGGLASLDVVKILMLETVLDKLQERGVEIDILELEHKSIAGFLEEQTLTLQDLGLKGCTLYYRRRHKDMPLAQIPPDATPERLEKVYLGRQKILHNFQNKFLFKFEELRFPTGIISENGRLHGLKFSETEMIDGNPVVKEGTEYEVRAPLVISSIGSIPEPVPGIDMNGELYDVVDRETGQLKQYENVFGLGNVITGKGNIKVSLTHGKQVADHVMDNFLAWREEDYQELIASGEESSKKKVDKIVELLNEKGFLKVGQVKSILNQVKRQQKRVGFNGGYSEWMANHRVERIDAAIARVKNN